MRDQLVMGSLEKFKEIHPICCFCGGKAGTESRDEVPPRTLFFGRHWPEGYQFPACKNCNGMSRLADQAIGLIARMSLLDEYADRESIIPWLKGVQNNSPDRLPELVTSPIEARKLLKNAGIVKSADEFSIDYNIALLDEETFRYLDVIFRKLFCAIYYKHTQKILRSGSLIARRCNTNAFLIEDEGSEWLCLNFLQNAPKICRNGQDLSQQFDYRWGYSAIDGIFAVSFHLRMGIFGLMIGPLIDSDLEEEDTENLLVVP